MSDRWLAIQSLQHEQSLLEAINTLSIYIKLKLSGIADAQREEAAERARLTLAAFFEEVAPMLRTIEENVVEPVLKANPRLCQLVERLVEVRQNHPSVCSALFQESLETMRRLLYAKDEEQERALIQCLAELRCILQEHINVDAEQVMGET